MWVGSGTCHTVLDVLILILILKEGVADEIDLADPEEEMAEAFDGEESDEDMESGEEEDDEGEEEEEDDDEDDEDE